MVQHKIVHFVDGDIKVEGEFINGKYLIHLEVFRYSHNVQKKIDSLFEHIKASAREAGTPDKVYSVSENQDYLRYMGGKRIKEVINNKGNRLGVFEWETS